VSHVIAAHVNLSLESVPGRLVAWSPGRLVAWSTAWHSFSSSSFATRSSIQLANPGDRLHPSDGGSADRNRV